MDPNENRKKNPASNNEALPSTSANGLDQHPQRSEKSSYVDNTFREAISLEHIRPYPEAPPRKTSNRGRKLGRFMIANDTPEKGLIRQKEIVGQNKRKKSEASSIKLNPVKRKLVEFDNAIDSSIDSTDDSSESSSESSSEPSSESSSVNSFIEKNIAKGDYVLIELKPTNKPES